MDAIQQLLPTTETDPCIEEEKWSEVGVIRSSPAYGKYVLASRRIEEGEIIIEEFPLQSTPYGPSDRLPYCLTCSKDLAFSELCSKCKWPICDNKGICENDSAHSEWECPIFAASGVSSKKIEAMDYTAIEVLRGLLLRSKDPKKWQRILSFEPHLESRRLSPDASKATQYVLNFISEKCKLNEYDEETIEKVTGVFAVNTFWAHKQTNKYSSLLFDKVTLLLHDCDPNTTREIMEKEVIVKGNIVKLMYIQIVAERTIEKGEMITIYYTDLGAGVMERQKYLKEAFYFDCKCSRCVRELMENLDINGNL